MLLALAIFTLAAVFGAQRMAASAAVELRLALLAGCVMGPAVALLVCIARLAKHRFFTPQDIDGSALTGGTPRARLLQALLQNTLEQLALALPVYMACALIFPARWLVLIPAAALMFLLGRVLFYAGYAGGAPSRAFGFALTFYPTALLAGMAIVVLAAKAIPA
ncbi:MAPEG family protein [uncultured Ramlibacter sp.]|uniref:MAPEG family protein n=1 Tax=uncultured Ramlibacter sp. TaxID=260755 RepID=UPI002627B2F1|nr:MAPEG family protein [uncultured Ramlibacter sp.]